MDHRAAVESLAVERYLLGEMAADERDAFEAHFFECAECADDVRVGALMRSGSQMGLTGFADTAASRPTRVVADRRPFRPRVLRSVPAAIPWAAAAMLAVAVGYQTLVVIPGLERAAAPQVLSPVTLRPASRGAEPVVPLATAGGSVSLAVDLYAASSAELTYRLRTDDGRSIAAGRVGAPAAGTPLLLFLPAWTLSPSERYILSIHSGGDGTLVDEYRFSTTSR